MLEGGATVLGSDDSLVLDYVVIQGAVKHNYSFGGWWLHFTFFGSIFEDKVH